MKRGEVWMTDLGPVQGAEQAGRRPAIVFQDSITIPTTRTVIVIPITTNSKLAASPICYPLHRGEGGLSHDSVALCFHIRATDKKRLLHRIGALSPQILADVQLCVSKTLGM